MEKGLEKAGWSASTLCRNDNNGNVCRRSTGASAVYGGSNGDTIGKGGAANGAAFYRGIFLKSTAGVMYPERVRLFESTFTSLTEPIKIP